MQRDDTKTLKLEFKKYLKTRKEGWFVPTFGNFKSLIKRMMSLRLLPKGAQIGIREGAEFTLTHEDWNNIPGIQITSKDTIIFEREDYHGHCYISESSKIIKVMFNWGKGLDVVVNWNDMTLMLPEKYQDDVDLFNVLDFPHSETLQ